MVTDCCTRYLGRGEVVCPACGAQVDVHRREMQETREFYIEYSDMRDDTRELLQRRAISAEAAGLTPSVHKSTLLRRNPNRRAVFQLLGIYLPEREARVLLRRIHEFKWIEAEKAGRDIWRTAAPRAPLKAAAQTWATNYLPDFLEHYDRHAA